MWLTVLALALAGVLGMDDILARVAALEAADVGSRARLSQLEDEAVRSRASQQAAGMAELTARLDPGSLTQIVPYPGGSERLPALAQPLLARLQSDGNLPGLAAGRTDPTSLFANVLQDPTFSTIPAAGSALTTVSANISDASPQWPYWNAWYVLNSGTAPATYRSFGRVYERWATAAPGAFTTNITSSGIAFMNMTWGAAAGDITVYLLANDYASVTAALPSWILAGVDVAQLGTTPALNVTSATAYVEIVDSGGTVLAQSDPEDVLALGTLDIRSRLETALESPAVSTAYYWRLRIDIVYPASAGNLFLAFSQPQLSWSEDGSLPQFTPAVGRWIPETQRYHGVRAYRTATQSIADVTDTAVTFPSGSASESWDTDAFHDMSSSTAQFEAPWDGYYQINAGIGFAGSAAGSIRDVWIEANSDGVRRALVRELNPTASDHYATTSVVLYLSAGAYVRLMVRQNSGGALNILGNERTTFLDMSLIGV